MRIPRAKRRLPGVITIFMAVFGLVIALNAVHIVGSSLFKDTVQRVVVSEGIIAAELAGEALFLRRELVLLAPQTGFWHPKVAAGQKVAVGTDIGEVLDIELLGQAQQLRQQARDELQARESRLMSERQRLDQALSEVYEHIQMVLTRLKNSSAPAQSAWVRSQNEKLQALLKERGRLLAEKECLAQIIATRNDYRQLDAEATELATKATTSIIAPMAGRFEDSLDGYEGLFDPLEYKAALHELVPIGSETAVSAGEYASEGCVIGKIVQEEPTFVRLRLPDGIRPLAPGHLVHIQIPGTALNLQAKVMASAKDIAVLELAAAPAELSSVRKTEVNITYRTVQGIIVPKESLIYQQDQAGVYCRGPDGWFFTPVEILAVDQRQAVVSGLKPGAEIAVGLRR